MNESDITDAMVEFRVLERSESGRFLFLFISLFAFETIDRSKRNDKTLKSKRSCRTDQ